MPAQVLGHRHSSFKGKVSNNTEVDPSEEVPDPDPDPEPGTSSVTITKEFLASGKGIVPFFGVWKRYAGLTCIALFCLYTRKKKGKNKR